MQIALSHHVLGDLMDTCTPDKPLVFVMEGPPGEETGRKKKKDKGIMNANAFGGALDISKYKGANKFVTSYRCRPEIQII